MPSTRQDAWTRDEDILLAEIVLRHIREGSTQLKAFEEVGAELSRTAAACGFRWNSFVRKQYIAGIELAKKQRKDNKKKQVVDMHQVKSMKFDHLPSSLPKQVNLSSTNEETIAFEEVIAYLRKLHHEAKNNCSLENNQVYENKLKQLETELIELETENDRLIQELYAVEEAYEALTGIMERTRKMGALHANQN